jgi:hypothetical protein
MRSRCAYASGDFDAALHYADRLERDAQARGSRRYLVLARVQHATATAAVGKSLDHDAVDTAVHDLAHIAGIDAWLITAELASRSRVDRWWTEAERFAAAFEGAAVRDPRTDAVVLRDHLAREFQRRGR